MKPDHPHVCRGAARVRWCMSTGVVPLDVPEESPLSSEIAVTTRVELLIRLSDGDSKVRLKGEESFVFAFRMLRLR